MKIFGNKKQYEDNIENLTIIGHDTMVSGDISASGDIRIDGKVKGSVTTDCRLVLGEQAIVFGNVVANNSEIYGEIQGNTKIVETLSLRKSSKMRGDIHAGKLSVEVGALIEGKCAIGIEFEKLN